MTNLQGLCFGRALETQRIGKRNMQKLGKIAVVDDSQMSVDRMSWRMLFSGPFLFWPRVDPR